MSKATEYEIKTVKWEDRPSVEGPAVFRKADGKKVSGAWVSGTDIRVIDTPKGAVAVIDAPNSREIVRSLLDA